MTNNTWILFINMLFLFSRKFICVSQLFLIVLFCSLIERSNSFELLTNENQNSDEKQYFDYYSEVEKKLRELEEKDNKLEPTEQTISLFEFIRPLIQAFKWTLISLFVIFFTFCIICVIISIDWTTVTQPLEYLPCQGYALLSARYEKSSTPGIYIRKDGTKEYYKPTEEEINLIVDIQNRLQK